MLVFVSIVLILLFNVYVLHKKKKLRSVLKSIYVLDIIDDVKYLLHNRHLEVDKRTAVEARIGDTTETAETFESSRPVSAETMTNKPITEFAVYDLVSDDDMLTTRKSKQIMNLLSNQSFIERGSQANANRPIGIESYSHASHASHNPTNQVSVDSDIVYNEPAYAFGAAEIQSMSGSQEKYLESLFDEFDGANISPYE